MSQLRKHLRFNWRNYLRSWFWRWKLGFLGKHVYIDQNVNFIRFCENIFIGNSVVIKEGARICSCNENAKIKIGDRTTFGYQSFIFASEGVEIGEDCLIAPFVYIVDSNHRINKTQKINQQENETEAIIIGNDVWIASNVTILKGVTISDGAIIAANSVVNSSVSAYEIWGGSPARKIGERK